MNVSLTLCPTKQHLKKLKQTSSKWGNLKSESVLALLFSNLHHTHSHMHTLIDTHHAVFPKSTLLMCEMSKGLISWKHTTEPEEQKGEEDTQWERVEKKEE